MNVCKISPLSVKNISFSGKEKNKSSKLVTETEEKRFNQINDNAESIKAEVDNLKGIGLSQKDLFLAAMVRDLDFTNPDIINAYNAVRSKLKQGVPYNQAIIDLKNFIPNKAVAKNTSLGLAIMAEGWDKPVIFPQKDGFKWVGWADNVEETTTDDLWESAYGYTPAVVLGAVGNSNIKPEQVKGGCQMSKKELSAQYEKAIENFYQPIIDYLLENGAKRKDIGVAFAHSYCGVDKAARDIAENNGLMGYATTPTEYTQYVKGTEFPPNEEFPRGYIIADFPFPTVLTRHQLTQIEDYANIYGKMVGKENPLGVFGGGEHAFTRDAREALIGNGGSVAIPVDIMKDCYGIEIPAVNEKGTVTNAARDMLEKIDGNPYEQFKYAFKYYLPNTEKKQDLSHDGMKAIATIAYTKLKKEGKIS